MAQGIGYYLKDVVRNEGLVEFVPVAGREGLHDRTALLYPQHRLPLPQSTRLARSQDTEKFLEEVGIILDMLNDLDLVVENQRVEYREGGIVKNSSENNVSQVLKSVGVVDPFPNLGVLDSDDLFELGFVGKVLTVVGLVARKIGIICDTSARGPNDQKVPTSLHSNAPTTPKMTWPFTTCSMMFESLSRTRVFMMLQSLCSSCTFSWFSAASTKGVSFKM